MKPSPLSLSVLAVAVGCLARAELRYVAYDLTTGDATEIPAPENLHDDRWHSASTMLFVQDTEVSEAYYLGVFEVTKGQAKAFGWVDPAGDTKPDEQAFAVMSQTFPTDLEGHSSLRFPTVTEWQAYADVASQERPCNIRNGRALGVVACVEPSVWWAEGAQFGKSAKPNVHGVVDIFGNVAEYTSDRGEFYGGWADTASIAGTFGTLTTCRSTGRTATVIQDQGNASKNNGRQGARLVYLPPEEVRHTAQVTLDGFPTETQTATEGKSVTLEWPACTAGHRRIARTVTPEGLALVDGDEFSAFRMPAANVTLAFTQKAVATLAVAVEGEGGTATSTRNDPPESFDTLPDGEVYVGETVTLTANPEPSWKVKEWHDATGAPLTAAGTAESWEYTLPADARPGSAVAFTVVFERPTYEVTVTLDGEPVEGWPQSFAEGETVSVTPPTPTRAGHRLYSGPSNLQPFTFEMRAMATTFAYTSRAYVGIAVRAEGNGTASAADPGAFIGDPVRLTAEPTGRWTFTEWRLGETQVSTSAVFSYTVPNDVTLAGTTQTLTAVFSPPPKHTARVTLGGVETWRGTFEEGETFVYPAPTPTAGHRLTVFPDGGDATGGAGTMDTANLTMAYQERPYANLVVKGNGSVSDASPLLGESVTLTATPPKYKAFRRWTGAATSTENPFVCAIPETCAPGATLTFTAEYDTLPRVLVTGGSFRVLEGSHAGEGHVSVGATLALTAAAAPAGYRFSHWVASGEGGALSGERFVASSELLNQTVTLTAVYEIDDTQPAINSAVTLIGEDANGTAPALTLGWEANGSAEASLLGNTFRHFRTREPDGDYALLGLAARTTAYAAEVTGTSVANKTSTLALKRIRPTAGTWYAEGDTYYVGIHETTEGHFKALGVKMANAARGDTYPYVFLASEGPDTFITALNAAFGLKATRPSVAQIENITRAGLKKGDADSADTAKTFNGAGYFHDGTGDGYWQGNTAVRRVTADMIVDDPGNGFSTACLPVGSKKADPYGFYDLWGNALEWLSDGTGHGGRAGYSGGLNAHPSWFRLEATDAGWSGSSGACGAVRPAVVVPRKVHVTLADGVSGETLGPFEVLPGQVVRLAPQVRTGHDFTGWTASAGVTLTQEDGRWVSSGLTQDATFTANYAAKPPLTLRFVGCQGPATALPGQTVTVYAEDPTGAVLTGLTLSPASAGTCVLEGTEATVTFSATANGTVTLTATKATSAQTLSVAYVGCEGPETVAPGATLTVPTGPRGDGGTLAALTVSPAFVASADVAQGTLTFSDDFMGTTDATVTATYAIPQAMVAWVGCEGPLRVGPGETVQVPLLRDDGRRLTALTADAAGARTWVGPTDAGVVFPANLTGVGAITVTAVYETPKAGYRLRLR